MSDSDAARPRHARAATWRRALRLTALAVVAVVAFVAVYAGTVVDRLDSTLGASAQDVTGIVGERPDRAEQPVDLEAGSPLTLLLMGSDARAGDENQTVGGGDVEGMRNDTTIILHISADRSRVEAVSIPRDAQVEVPECTYLDGTTVAGATGDFNTAFAHGGARGSAAEAAACTIATVELLTGIYIDHYAVVDFAGFIDMVDALGGVPMCIPERIVSSKAHLDLQPGAQILDGTTALAYARLRTAEVGDVSGSDLQRITRQQQLLEQVAATARAKSLLTDVDELTRFIRAAAESLTMDPELADTRYLLGLASSLRGVAPADIDFVTVPWAYTEDLLNVRILPEAEQMWDDIRNDRPISVTADGDASSAWDDGRTGEDPSSPAPSTSDEPAATSSDGSGTASSTPSVEDLLDACR